MFTKTILSLYDNSGNWCKPYRDHGYNVLQFDQAINGVDIRLLPKFNTEVYGILAAPPCTKFCRPSYQHNPTDQELIAMLHCVDVIFRLIYLYKPVFYAIENPPGRLQDYLGEPAFKFCPSQYGSSHTKLTYLWGKFSNPVLPTLVPLKVIDKSWYDNKKDQRSVTPLEFSNAFFSKNQ